MKGHHKNTSYVHNTLYCRLHYLTWFSQRCYLLGDVLAITSIAADEETRKVQG